MKMHRHGWCWDGLSLIALLMLLAVPASGQSTWDAGGDGVDWGDGANWSGNTVPGAGAHVIFNNTGTGTNPKVFDQDRTIGWWDFDHTSGAHDFDLDGNTITLNNRFWLGRYLGGTQSVTIQNGTFVKAAGDHFKVGRDNAARDTDTTLTFDDVLYSTTGSGPDFFRVGVKENNDNDYFTRGTLDLTGVRPGSYFTQSGGDVRVGFGGRGYGYVNLPNNTNLLMRIGNPNRPHFYVGFTEGRVVDGHYAEGIFNGGQASVEFDVEILYIGYNEQNTGAATGRVDFSSSSGFIRNRSQPARIGLGRQASGTLLLGEDMDGRFGIDQDTRVEVLVGHTQGRNAAGMVTTGHVHSAGGEFNIFANTLYIGENASANGIAGGVVDLSAASGGTVLTHAGTTRIGSGGRTIGRLLLNDGMSLQIGKNARTTFEVGRGETRNANGELTIGELIGGELAEGTIRAGWIYVGENEHTTGEVRGLVDLRDALSGEFSTEGQSFRVGYGRRAIGEVYLSANHTVSIGQPAARTWLRIGETLNYDAGGVHTYGYFEGPLGGYFNLFYVGNHESANDGGATGIVNAASTPSSHAGINVRGGQFRSGFGKNAHGYVYLGEADDLIGNSDDRTWLRVGHGNYADSVTTGYVHKAGGTFEGHFNNFKVGAYAGSGSTVYGELDLRDTTLTANGIHIQDPVRIGQGAGATGIVRLPAGNVWNQGHFYIGESGGTGLLQLNGTTWTNNWYFDVFTDGQVEINVAGEPSGLVINSDGTDRFRLSPATYRGEDSVIINFDTPTDVPNQDEPYWGLRWRDTSANKVTILQGYLDSDYIKVNIASGAALDMSDLYVGVMSHDGDNWAYIGFTNSLAGLAVSTLPAQNVVTDSADLRGTVVVDASGSADLGFWWWAQSTPGASNSLAFAGSHPGTGNNFVQNLTGLSADTAYSFRAWADDGVEQVLGSVQSFTTAGDPTVTTSGGAVPGAVGEVQLNANITRTDGINTTATIYWGESDGGTSGGAWDFYHTFAPTTATGPISHTADSLLYGVQYYYRAFVTNAYGHGWASATVPFTAPAPGDPGPLSDGLVLWLNAGALGLSNGDPVTSWADASGAGNDASTVGGDPTFVSTVSQFNNQPAVDFDGDDYLRTVAQFTQPYTVFSVARQTGGQNARVISSGNVNWLLGFHGGSYDKMFVGGWVDNGGSAANTAAHLHMAHSMSSPGYTAFYNVAGLIASNANHSAIGTLDLGSSSFGEYSKAEVAEVIIYDRVLTHTERLQVGGYLATKYGLSTAYFDQQSRQPSLDLTTDPADVTGTTADLNATFSAPGAVYTVYAVWGQDDEGDDYEAWEEKAVVGTYTNVSTPTAIQHVATDLSDPAFYYFRFFGSNVAHEAWSETLTFTIGTLEQPTVTNQTVTAIGTQTATLGADLVSDGGASTSVTLYWGQSNGGQNTTGWGTGAGSATFAAPQSVGTISTNLTGLTANTDYYFIFRAVNALGTTWSHTTGQKFTTHLASGTFTWDEGGDEINWNDPLNWVADGVPNTNALVTFGNTGVGADWKIVDTDRAVNDFDLVQTGGNHGFDLNGGTLTIRDRLRNAYLLETTSQATAVFTNGTLRLLNPEIKIARDNAARNADARITVDGAQVVTDGTGVTRMRIGRGQNSDNDYFTRGILDLTGVTTGSEIRQTGNDVLIGYGRRSYGQILLGENMTLRLGDPAITTFYLGDTDARNVDGSLTEGYLDAGEGAFYLDASFFRVGYNETTSGEVRAIMDLSQATGHVRNSTQAAQIGFGRQAYGEIQAGPDMDISFGLDASTRVQVDIGRANSRNSAGMSSTGRVVAVGGDMSVYANHFYLGENESNDGDAYGLLDASAAGSGTILTHGSTTRIGAGGRAIGRLLLGSGMNLELGDTTRSAVHIGDALGSGRNADGDWTFGEIDGGAASLASIRATTLYVGHNQNNTGSATGRVDLTSAASVTIDTDGSLTRVGFGRQTKGEVLLPANATVSIGESGNRTLVDIGSADGRNADGMIADGLWSGPFSGHISQLLVGHNQHTAGAALGLLDASAADSVLDLRGSSMRIGFGKDSKGTVLLGGGLTRLGNHDQRSGIWVGLSDNRANSTYSIGSFHKVGGTFEGYIGSLEVGFNSGNVAGTGVEGVFDLRDTELTANGIYIHDHVRIGEGQNATGRVYMTTGVVTNNSWMVVGDSQSGSSGFLQLNNTDWLNVGDVDVRASGQIEINVAGTSSGLTKPTGSITLIGADSIVLNFDTPDFDPTPSDPYWGLRWQGDHVATVDDWIGDGRLSYTIESGAQLQSADFAVDTYTDSESVEWTFVGFTAKIGDVDPPVVTNAAATAVEYISATLNGELLDRGGLATTITVYWGTENELEDKEAWEFSYTFPSSINTSPTPLEHDTGNTLAQGTQYFFRYYATNSVGDHWASPVLDFTTKSGATAPVIENMLPTGLSGTTATLNGNLSQDSSVGDMDTTVRLFWGMVNQGQAASGWANEVNFGVQTVGQLSTNLTGLASSTDYYFIWRAENDLGVSWGAADGQLFSTHGTAGTLTWDGGAASSMHWQDKDNWDPDQVPNSTATVIFNNTDTGEILLVDTDRSVGNLRIENTDGNMHTFDLQGGQLALTSWMYVGRNLHGSSRLRMENGAFQLGSGDLRIGERDGADPAHSPNGTLILDGVQLRRSSADPTSYLRVGYNNAAANSVEGLLDLSGTTAGSLLQIRNHGTHTSIGEGYAATGTVYLSNSALATNIFGTSAQRMDLRVGDGLNHVFDTTTLVRGTLHGGAGRFESEMQRLYIGRKDSTVGQANGTVDLSDVAAGSTLHLYGNQTYIGFAAGATGRLMLGANLQTSLGMPSSRTDLRIGARHNHNVAGLTTGLVYTAGGDVSIYASIFYVGENDNANGEVQGLLDLQQAQSGVVSVLGGQQTRIGFGRNAHGSVYLGASDDMIGTSASTTWLRLGHGHYIADSVTTGYVHKAGGTFEGHFNYFKVGAYAGSDSTAYGVLDLRDTTLTANGIRILDPARIGQGAGATGRVYLPAGNVDANSTLFVGEGGDGLLQLNGTSWTNNNSVTVGQNGVIEINVAGPSSGLTKLTTGTMSLTGAGSIEINFANPSFTVSDTNPYWGFRWEGNHVVTVQGWLDTGVIAVNVNGDSLTPADLQVETYTDENTVTWTYVGFDKTVFIPQGSVFRFR